MLPYRADNLISAHKEAIFFYKAFGSWPGGDPREIFELAKAFGMPENEINYSCSGCFGNALDIVFDNLNKTEYEEYKRKNGA